VRVISIKDSPEYFNEGLAYIQKIWASPQTQMVYQDCLTHMMTTDQPLPQWWLLVEEDNIIGCAGLITNDFISRMDLYPWLCALYVDPNYRGKGYGSLLISEVEAKASEYFDALHLCTDHIGYYEKYGYEYLGDGYHPWDEVSRIYRKKV
jgi:GNAT superfamily N-acetyltransferase